MIPRIQSASTPSSNHQQTNFDKLQQRTCSANVSLLENSKTFTRIVPPVVTAAAWGIHDLHTGEMLWEKNADEQREMASLTKTMTCLLTHQLLTQFNQDPEKLSFKVNQVAARICGTHSGLRENDTVRVIDLLYGLMLPSGNDCAMVLAYEFGNMLVQRKRKDSVDPVQKFVKEMNKLASKLGLKNTCFTNPHGLSEKGNKSTVSDLGRLGFHAMQVPLIEKIVSTQTYEANVTDSKGHTRRMIWRNTNKLLEKGFLGLKTGTTPNAGLCLTCVLKNGDDGVIVTILNARSETHRWVESEKLAQWAMETITTVREKMKCFSDSTKAKITAKLIAGISKHI